ncbi:MAG: ester cyclase [Acetobacteraceae bacterium]|nr:ester cyclase [Acetobacteraceae bacterium]
MSLPGLWGRDIAELLAPQGPPRQPMRGFDPDYADIVDYIIRCTHRIWEQKDLGLIETHYSADCPVWMLSGPAAGLRSVVDGTTRTLATFPDRTLIGEAVIWSGDDRSGYLSSHRILSTATHQGAGEFGPPTGRRIAFRTVADCLCRENRIVEEWLVRDNSHIALQLGLSPAAIAAAQAAHDRPDGAAPRWWAAEIERVRASPSTGLPAAAMPAPEAAPSDFALWFADTIVAHRRLARVRDAYAPAAVLEAPGGRRLFGHGEIIGWWAALLGSIGGSRIVVDHVAAQPAGADPADGVDIAMRWSLAGVHDGPALFGSSSGRAVLLLAVTHWRVVGGRIVREWTVFDEIAVRRQTLAPA